MFECRGKNEKNPSTEFAPYVFLMTMKMRIFVKVKVITVHNSRYTFIGVVGKANQNEFDIIYKVLMPRRKH